MLPHPTPRPVTSIAPSYEDKADYRQTLNTVNEGLKRFPTGCFIIWYPLVQRIEAQDMARSLERLRVADWVHASLTVHKPANDGYGLHGNGVFVINTPWPLSAALELQLPWLADQPAQAQHDTPSPARRH